MYFEWDKHKRQLNIAKHGLDFPFVTQIFDDRPIFTVPSLRGGEDRFLSIASLNNTFVAVVWTWRGDTIRIISARRARLSEIAQFQQAHPPF